MANWSEGREYEFTLTNGTKIILQMRFGAHMNPQWTNVATGEKLAQLPPYASWRAV